MVKMHAPIHLQIYEREGTKWFFHGGEVFYNARGIPTDLDSTLKENGLTRMNVVAELFRINGGKSGFYIANVRDKKYYYCGQGWENVKAQLRSLGIGRDDPMESGA
ncbi:hypothetical protein IQ229_15155 [Nostoc cf. edaphicum LEGE 07299]|uniref:Uncharacterized protein n=2 Tax=Nostoc TaxID=1177 RepID=A0ABR9U0N5_9NOSO|nr:hypothetical protein [Nostoc edaphicum]MBE9106224.1 hypothetical protein [Nostoc cf. edaphicum LEGE 07299]